MAEKPDLRALNRVQLLEMLQRQEKLLSNKKFIQSLPDKGAKINQLVEKLKSLIGSKMEVDDLSSQFNSIQLSGHVRLTQRDTEIDSDDDDDFDVKEVMDSVAKIHIPEEQPSRTTEQILEKPRAPQSTWDYDSAVTHSHFYKRERAKGLSLEESMKLQEEHNKQHKILIAEHAAKRLQEQLAKGHGSSYAFSSKNSKYKYLDVNETEEYRQQLEPDSDKGSDKESNTSEDDDGNLSCLL